MRLALYCPEIAQNVGTLLRLAACWQTPVDIVEPCGFPFDDRKLRRAGMDYMDQVDLTRHADWSAFRSATDGSRLVLLTTKGAVPHTDFAFSAGDILLLGQEGAGVPPEVHAAADARIRLPMAPEMRSLNVAVAGAVALGEALRQTGGFPASAGV